jgi:iron complex outermembrane receptor protein
LGREPDYNNRILLMLNGNTTNDGVYGSAAVGTDYQLDLRVIDRVEIIHGPGSSLYGTGAVFAVINIITKRGLDMDGLMVSGELGSYGRNSAAAFFGKKYANRLDIAISGQITDVKGPGLYFPEFDSPATNHGVVVGLDWDKNHGFSGTAKMGDFLVQGALVSRNKGVPTASFDTNFNDSRAFTHDTAGLAELQYSHDYGINKNLLARAYYNRYYGEGRFPYGRLSIECADSQWYGGEIRFRWDSAANNRIIIGAEYQNHFQAEYKCENEVSTFVEGNWPYSVYSFYLQDEFQIRKNLSLTAGVRADHFYHSNIRAHASPRFGVVYHPFGPSSVKLLYGEAFRKPSIYELYVYDPESGIKPNADLKPEGIRTLELGWEERLGANLLAFASVYRYRMKNLIDWIIDPADDYTQARNLGRVSAWGMEMGFQAQLGKKACCQASYSLQDAKDYDTGLQLTNSPRHLLKGMLVLPLLRHLFISSLWQYESGRTTVAGTKTDPFLLTHLTMTSHRLFDHLSASLQVRNLFDSSYSYPGGPEHLQPSILQNGREFSLRLEYRF